MCLSLTRHVRGWLARKAFQRRLIEKLEKKRLAEEEESRRHMEEVAEARDRALLRHAQRAHRNRVSQRGR